MSYDRYLTREVGPYYIWQCDEDGHLLDNEGNCPMCSEEDDEDE